MAVYLISLASFVKMKKKRVLAPSQYNGGEFVCGSHSIENDIIKMTFNNPQTSLYTGELSEYLAERSL